MPSATARYKVRPLQHWRLSGVLSLGPSAVPEMNDGLTCGASTAIFVLGTVLGCLWLPFEAIYS